MTVDDLELVFGNLCPTLLWGQLDNLAAAYFSLSVIERKCSEVHECMSHTVNTSTTAHLPHTPGLGVDAVFVGIGWV